MSINLNPIIPAHTLKVFQDVAKSLAKGKAHPETPFVIMDKQWQLQHMTIEGKTDGTYVVNYGSLIKFHQNKDTVKGAFHQVYAEVKASNQSTYTDFNELRSVRDQIFERYTLEGDRV